MRTLLTGVEDAFLAFGGVPRELLFDQMKAVITRDPRLHGGALVHNLEFLRFAHHWGFTPRACRPYRAQTGGGEPVGCLVPGPGEQPVMTGPVGTESSEARRSQGATTENTELYFRHARSRPIRRA